MSNLIVEPLIDKKGNILNNKSVYQPSKEVLKRNTEITLDFRHSNIIMDGTYEEYGRLSSGSGYMDLVTRQNENQKRFNNLTPPKSLDPDEAWHANTVRPLTRNKVISIVAHITNSIMFPNVVAQNEDGKEDKDMAVVMQDAMEWVLEQSDYENMFIDAIQDMCVNPAIILEADYIEAMRTIKELQEDGTIVEKEVLDEVFSGFINAIVPNEELYIENIYEPNIQKQNHLIRRKVISYATAQTKYGEIEDFKRHVKPGLRHFFSSEEDTFYEQYDESLQDRLVEEVTYYNRKRDLELVFVNGIMMTDPNAPLRRKDKKYPFAKSVFETYNSRFFYGMSMVQKITPDQDVIDVLYNYIIDGTYQQLMPPISVFGTSEIDGTNFQPGMTNAFDSPDVKVEPLNIGNNLNAGLSVLQKTELSASESSSSDPSQGISAPGSQTATEITTLERNARIVLGRTGKMVGSLVKQFGDLMLGLIVQHLPIADLSQITGDETQLKFPVLFLQDREVEGKKKTKVIEFTEELPEAGTEEELEKKEQEAAFELMEEEDKTGQSISKVRPSIFREMKYLTKVEPDFANKVTKFSRRMMLFDRAINNPIINQEVLMKETLLKELAPKGKEEKFITKQQNPVMDEVQKMSPQANQMAPKGQPPLAAALLEE